jgi:hypothetical protein
MISDQTAMHARTLAPVSTDGVAFTSTRSTAVRKQVCIVASRTLTMTIALLRALAAYGNPPYFQLERRGPVQQRLAPGVSRESDSFGQSRSGSGTQQELRNNYVHPTIHGMYSSSVHAECLAKAERQRLAYSPVAESSNAQPPFWRRTLPLSRENGCTPG